ncbi:MAG: hypothetical protein EBW96_01645 [Actinobacteria bacterium]|nr:hypothetical protein [Actinomycetota bacterium]
MEYRPDKFAGEVARFVEYCHLDAWPKYWEGSKTSDSADGVGCPWPLMIVTNLVANGIERAVERSSANGAQALILQVNSPGAVVDEARMTALLRALRESPLPIAMWVGPSGARAHGWAAQMLAVVDVSAMAPNSTIGNIDAPLRLDIPDDGVPVLRT